MWKNGMSDLMEGMGIYNIKYEGRQANRHTTICQSYFFARKKVLKCIKLSNHIDFLFRYTIFQFPNYEQFYLF